MFKKIIEPGIFGRRSRKVLARFCDGCGQKITYSSSGEYGNDLCEDCFKKQKAKSNEK